MSDESSEVREWPSGGDAPTDAENKLHLVVDGIRFEDLSDAERDRLTEHVFEFLSETCDWPPLAVSVTQQPEEEGRVAVPHASDVPTE